MASAELQAMWGSEQKGKVRAESWTGPALEYDVPRRGCLRTEGVSSSLSRVLSLLCGKPNSSRSATTSVVPILIHILSWWLGYTSEQLMQRSLPVWSLSDMVR